MRRAGSWWMETRLGKHGRKTGGNAVDGRNPAAVDRWFIHVYLTIFQSIINHPILLQDFFPPFSREHTLHTWTLFRFFFGDWPIGKKTWDFDIKKWIYCETRGFFSFLGYWQLKFHNPKLRVDLKTLGVKQSNRSGRIFHHIRLFHCHI